MHTELLNQVSLLSIDDQIDLVESIWDGIASRSDTFDPPAAQRAELKRRLADDDANPADAKPWESVKAAALAQLGKPKKISARPACQPQPS
jgi:putative addiction module component (TIGR02574 family)